MSNLIQNCNFYKMFQITKTFTNLLNKSLILNNCNKTNITTSAFCNIKNIQIKQDDNAVVIEGVFTESDRANKLIPEAKQKNFCPECTLGLEIKHTDVLILSQYVRSDGCMLPQRVTKLCRKQQRKIGTMVTMAQKAGLMPNLAPSYSKKDPKQRYKWKKHNKYFDETTIKC